jgi:uncharacterized membrane protein
MAEPIMKRHRSFFIAVAVGIVVGLASLVLAPALAITLGVNSFFLLYLALTFAAARKLSAEFLRVHAAEEDEPAPFILLVMFAAVAVSAISLFLVLIQGEPRMALQLSLSVASVVLGWFAVHTMWAMHYAFEYYKAPDNEQGKRTKSGKVRAGLDFPGGEEPNGVAFVYFAYVIGMTAQTSDTAITSNAMRRLVIAHGVFSFFFNTVIVAAAVNIAVALAH